ncbi:hypothetical protein C8A05DRAFT_15089, partial [Staphylotrichum tortipilum]
MAENQNTDIQALTALVAQLVKAQTVAATAATTGQRRIPMIDKLTKQEEFPIWRDKLIRTLRRLDLDDYILKEVPEPEGVVDKAQWNNNRADIEDYLQAVIPGHKIWSILKGMGWDSEVTDPKKTFDKITQYFEKGSADSNVKMMQELAAIRRGNFDKMDSFQLRVNYLRERINKSEFKMEEKAYTWLALKGIMTEYPQLYSRMVTNIQNDNLSWGDLMAKLQELAVVESAQPAMTNIKGNKAPNGNTNNNNNNNNNNKPQQSKTNDKPRETCNTCQKSVYKGAKHCVPCGRHF